MGLESINLETTNKRIRRTKEESLQNKIVQEKLELAIVNYQLAVEENDDKLAKKYYDVICEVYPPLDFLNVWYKKYKHLYETREDFTQEYLYVFCKALKKWQPRSTRPESKYKGSGEFKNYFWSNLTNYFTNAVKFHAAGIRNVATVCPICNKYVQALSTHLLQHHGHILWEQLKIMGHDIEVINHCPLCKTKSHKVPSVANKKYIIHDYDVALELTKIDALKAHMLSKHSSLLFEKFNDLYPEHDTLNARPVSNYVIDDSGDHEVNLYDTIVEEDPIAMLWSTNLSDIQKKILEMILVGKNKKIIYSPDLYNCSQEEFQGHMDDLKQKLLLCGLEG